MLDTLKSQNKLDLQDKEIMKMNKQFDEIL